MTAAPVLIFAVGNESRGDDAVAPLLLRKLGEWLEEQGLSGRVELLEDFQLQVEHAADMAGRELVLFMDAGMDTPAPYSFRRARPDDNRTLFSHAITPESVLSTYLQVYRQEPPPAFILCVRGEDFELGKPLSAQTGQYMESAMQLLHRLATNAELPYWNSCLPAG